MGLVNSARCTVHSWQVNYCELNKKKKKNRNAEQKHKRQNQCNPNGYEESQNQDQLIPNWSYAITYLIDDRRALWDFLDRQALWDFYTFSVSGFQRESDIVFVGYVLGYLFKFCCGLFSRAEKFVIFCQGCGLENVNVLVQN